MIKYAASFIGVFNLDIDNIKNYNFKKIDFSASQNQEICKNFLKTIKQIKKCNFINDIGEKEIKDFELIFAAALNHFNKRLINIERIDIGYLNYDDLFNEAAMCIKFSCKNNQRLAVVEENSYTISLTTVFGSGDNDLELKDNLRLKNILAHMFKKYFKTKYDKDYVETATKFIKMLVDYQFTTAENEEERVRIDNNYKKTIERYKKL